MCGSMRLNGRRTFHNELVPILGIEHLAGQSILRVWRKSARVESYTTGKWNLRSPVRGVVPATSYWENDCEFPVPDGHGILGIVADEMPGMPPGRAWFCLTRPATDKELKQAVEKGFAPHHRHPVFLSLDKTEVPAAVMV